MALIKKGEMQAQIFVYILGAVLVVSLMAFGYSAIKDMKAKGEKLSLEEFKIEITKDVNSIKGAYDSVKSVKYTVPQGFDEICFVDSNLVIPDDILEYPFIENNIISGGVENVFLFGKDNNIESFQIAAFAMPLYPHFACISLGLGVFEVQMIGKGNATTIMVPANRDYCMNAYNQELCDGLDIAFGNGYQQKCCREFGICC